jgi:hypothetical protein
MGNNFDLRKYLAENKLTSNSRLNEGRDVTVGANLQSKTKEEAMKELQSKIDYSKEIDGSLKKFSGVKWVGEMSEDDVVWMADQNTDSLIILAQGDKGLFYAYSKKS